MKLAVHKLSDVNERSTAAPLQVAESRNERGRLNDCQRPQLIGAMAAWEQRSRVQNPRDLRVRGRSFRGLGVNATPLKIRICRIISMHPRRGVDCSTSGPRRTRMKLIINNNTKERTYGASRNGRVRAEHVAQPKCRTPNALVPK